MGNYIYFTGRKYFGPKQALGFAAPEVPAPSTKNVIATAVSVPNLVEGAMTVEYSENETCYTSEGDCATSSPEMVPEVVEEKLVKGREAVPTDRITAAD